ncbi:MAG: hypothetical protein ACM3VW_07860 [Bacteroidota bacterium]
MLALAIAIIGTSSFSLIIRHTQRLRHDQFAIMAINYLAASAMGFAVAGSHLHPSPPTVGIAIFGGIFFVVAYVVLIHSMDLQGVAIANAMARLSVLIPVLASIIIWHERPQLFEVLGGVLALTAMPLLSLDSNSKGGRLTRQQVPLLFALFVSNGLCVLSSKWFHTTGLEAERPLYFALLFLVAGLVALGCWLIWSRRCGWPELVWGMLLGVINLVTGLAVIRALDTLSGSVVFPVFAAVSLSLTAGAAAWLWKEVPGHRGRWGIAVATAAVVLINVHL